MSEIENRENGDNRRRSRRDALGIVGLGAAGLVGGAALGRPGAASAADGGALVMGQTNSATNKTELDTSGTITNDGALKVVAAQADYGVVGTAKTIGTFGSGVVGVLGDGAVGGQFAGTDAAINLEPRATPGPPGGTNFKGDIALDSDGVLWLCIKSTDASASQWIKISHGGIRLLDSPQRVYDSRSTGGKFGANEQRTVPVTAAVPAIPANAVGVVANLTVVDTESVGFLTAWPTGTPKPGTSNINWFTPNEIVANAATIRLGTGGAVDVFALRPTNFVMDATGYVL
jgi:hypothetical protein